jgi:hypothetical protein
MTPEEQAQYKTEPDAFWGAAFMYDGYSMMAIAEARNWETIGGWGKAGWNLGYWPYVIIFFRDREGFFDVLEYCEGDVTMWACPTAEIREEITNGLALYHWKHNEYSAPDAIKEYETLEQLPDEYKGPYCG